MESQLQSRESKSTSCGKRKRGVLRRAFGADMAVYLAFYEAYRSDECIAVDHDYIPGARCKAVFTPRLRARVMFCCKSRATLCPLLRRNR